MLKRFGRKFIQGAKAELEENPPEILDTDRLMDAVKAGIALLGLGLLIFSERPPKQPTTVITNNYYYYK